MKTYTDLEQSKKLAEILPHNTADGTWKRVAIAGINLDVPEEQQYFHDGDTPFVYYSGIGIPSWSLAALLGVLPETMLGKDKDGYVIMTEKMGSGLVTTSDNPVDACVKMVLKLNELNLL